MKENVLVFTIVGIMLLGVGYYLGMSDPSNTCIRKHQTVMNDGRIVIIPVDTVDGRPTYTVLFEDEKGMDSMYPEEIANGLATGDWKYNEDFRITLSN